MVEIKKEQKKMAHYFIFGYGSLIYKDSRDKSGESGDSIPVKVNGIRRGWNIAISQARAVALSDSANHGPVQWSHFLRRRFRNSEI